MHPPHTHTGVSVTVSGAPALSDLAGLSQLRSVPGDLVLSLLPSLPSLTHLTALQSTGLNLVVASNTGLTSLEGLGATVLGVQG